ncbi:MAG: hypothetical protein HQK83_19045, partial [Fibrobacteria bacterium]|nr:hypothetical protein [Fibrobacteria bacterium]
MSVKRTYPESSKKVLLLSLLFLTLSGTQIQAQTDSICVDAPDSVAAKRPLLNQFKAVYTDAILNTWNASSYGSVLSTLQNNPPIKGVKLILKSNAGGEFIDRRVGGVTQANVLRGLNYALDIAKGTLPQGLIMLPTPSPIINVTDWGANTNDGASAGARNGVGWAWNSLIYTLGGVVYETVYFYHGSLGTSYGDAEFVLVADKAAPICRAKLPAPVADPSGSAFAFKQLVNLTDIVSDAEIFFSLDGGAYEKFSGSAITLIDDAVLTAYAVKTGWENSDTISEQYTKTDKTSRMLVTKITGEPLGGGSNLTELDSKFIIQLSSPYSGLTSVSIVIATDNGKDEETITITNPQTQNNALIFTDTVNFAVTSTIPGNGMVEVLIYDSVRINWVNPLNNEDILATVIPVKPSPREAKIYFADTNGNEVLGSLTGTETTLYIVVEDAVFDPARLQDYKVILSNKKGDGNESSADIETYPLVEITPGKYGATVSAIQSPPVNPANGQFEIRIGDELKASYTNPIDPSEKTDIIGYGVPTQLPGQVVFTNADGSVPTTLMAGNYWDGSSGKVYLKYTDDYILSLNNKKAKITVTSTDAMGRNYTDVEIVNLPLSAHSSDLGIWTAEILLSDSKDAIAGDGLLQYYFKAVVTVQVATHLTGTSERLEGDTAKTLL